MTSFTPTPGGEVAVIDVSLTTFTSVAALFPNITAVAPVKPVPVIVTVAPPVSSGSPTGETPLTAGSEVSCDATSSRWAAELAAA